MDRNDPARRPLQARLCSRAEPSAAGPGERRRVTPAAGLVLCAVSVVLSGCATAAPQSSPSTSAPTTSARSASSAPGSATPGSPNTSGRIVYQSEHGLALVNGDGSNNHLLLADPSVKARHPDWSPDGTTIAYEADDSEDTTDIWLVGGDGANPRRIVDCRRPCSYAQTPAWSPDGTQIAYSRGDFAPSVTQDIRVIDVATGREVKKFTFPAYVGVIDPRWSPDGTKIAYTEQRFQGPAIVAQLIDGAVGLLDVAGSQTNGHPITPWTILGSYPAWSPTGDRIVFQAGDEEPFPGTAGHVSNIWVVRPDGSGLRQLTHQGSDDPRLFGPDWGGGPHPIRVAIYVPDSSLVLGMLDPDGSHLQPLTDATTNSSIGGAHQRWTATPS